MAINKWWLYGGAGVAVLAVGAIMLSRGGGSDASASDDLTYYPSMVFGGGTVPSAAPGGLNASEAYSGDNSIAQMIASNFATAQLQADTSKYVADTEKAIMLATLENERVLTLDTNKSLVQQSLATQLGAVVNAFTTKSSKSSSGFLGIGGGSSSTTKGPGSIVGEIGFEDGKIKIDIASGPALSTAPKKAA
jgi:hypothetical protein